MEFSEQALILRMGKFKEADLWVRFLSPSRGVYTAFAFGGSRSIRRFCGCLDVLNNVLVRVVQSCGRQYLNLKEGTLISGPRRLRKDLNRLGIAVNCLSFIEAFDLPPESAGPAHNLLSQLLTLLEDEEALPPMLPMFFRFRFACEQGFAPRLSACRACQCNTADLPKAFFQAAEGGLLCPACFEKSAFAPAVRLERSALFTLLALKQKQLNEWNALDISKEIREQCARAIDDFIEYQVGLSWQGSYFRRN